MSKYFLIWWEDHEVYYKEEFGEEAQLETRYTEIAEREQRDDGVGILAVFYGREVELEPQELKTRYRLKRQR